MSCVELIWSKGLKGHCKVWAGGHGDKVLAAMIKSGSGKVRSEASVEIKPLVKGDLQKWAEVLVTPHPKTQKAKKGSSSGEATKGAAAASKTQGGATLPKGGAGVKKQGAANAAAQRKPAQAAPGAGTGKAVVTKMKSQTQHGEKPANKKAKRA